MISKIKPPTATWFISHLRKFCTGKRVQHCVQYLQSIPFANFPVQGYESDNKLLF